MSFRRSSRAPPIRSPLAEAEDPGPDRPCWASRDVEQVCRRHPPPPLACPWVLVGDPTRVGKQRAADDMCARADRAGLQESLQMESSTRAPGLPELPVEPASRRQLECLREFGAGFHQSQARSESFGRVDLSGQLRCLAPHRQRPAIQCPHQLLATLDVSLSVLRGVSGQVHGRPHAVQAGYPSAGHFDGRGARF